MSSEQYVIYFHDKHRLQHTGIDAGIYVRGGAQFVDEESNVPIGSRAVPAGTNPPIST
jgi:hypothetical protein